MSKIQWDFPELRANEIVNHFMDKGASVNKNDYEYIRDLFIEQRNQILNTEERTMTQGEQEIADDLDKLLPPNHHLQSRET